MYIRFAGLMPSGKVSVDLSVPFLIQFSVDTGSPNSVWNAQNKNFSPVS